LGNDGKEEGEMMQSVRVIPAVLTDNPQTLQIMLQQAEKFTNYVQIDIMDGKFVPSKSVTWDQIINVPQKIKWEAHLMVEHPELQLKNFQKAGATKIIFHYEAISTPEKIISAARQLGISIGLAVNPETPVSAIDPLADKVDSVLFLAVHPGFYGAKFIPEVLDKIVELRRKQPELNIGIDGGIKESNIASIASIGVNEIFVGSAIFLQPDPSEGYQKLSALASSSVKS
jgi:ribulose-phosphate 3-epimerase